MFFNLSQKAKYLANYEGVLGFKSRGVSASVAVVIFSFIFLSQFYILPSGFPQPGHWFGLILIGLSFCLSFPSFPLKNNILILLFCFLIYAFLLNSFWAIKASDLSFLRDNFFILYDFSIFISLSVLINNYSSSKRYIIIAGLGGFIFLLLVWHVGFGRYNFIPRYNGFFNDPNQMAFWILCVSAICILLAETQIIRAMVLLLAFALIALTLSRSGLLGIVPLAFGGGILVLSRYSLHKGLLVFSVISILFVALAYFGYFEFFGQSIERFRTTDFAAHADIRGYTRILKYPEYLFFGAGKGLDSRFGTNLEIHSTWVGLFFYYGIVGLGLVLLALYKIASRLAFAEKLLFLAPLAYGFATYGFRTPIFWVFLAVFAHVSLSRRLAHPTFEKVRDDFGRHITETSVGEPS